MKICTQPNKIVIIVLALFPHSKLTTRSSCMMAETLPIPQTTKIAILNCSMATNTAQKGRGPQILVTSVGTEMEMMKA